MQVGMIVPTFFKCSILEELKKRYVISLGGTPEKEKMKYNQIKFMNHLD